MAAPAKPKITLKLLIDTKGKRVLFTEVNKDCVDFLINILYLLVATPIELLKNQGMVGCIGNLYHSIEKIDDTYLQPGLSKYIMLTPKSTTTVSIPLLSLEGNIASNGKEFYVCGSAYGFGYRSCSSHVSDGPGSICSDCSRGMTRKLAYIVPPNQGKKESWKVGFVKEVVILLDKCQEMSHLSKLL